MYSWLEVSPIMKARDAKVINKLLSTLAKLNMRDGANWYYDFI